MRNIKIFLLISILVFLGTGNSIADLMVSNTDEMALNLDNLIDLTLDKNSELQFLELEMQMIRDKKESLERNFSINFEASPEIKWFENDSEFALSPILLIKADQEFWGGKISAQLNTSYDIDDYDFNNLNSTFSLNYNKTLIDNNSNNIAENEYQRIKKRYFDKRQSLIKDVYSNYFQILEINKTLEIAKEKLKLAEMKEEYSELRKMSKKEQELYIGDKDLLIKAVNIEEDKLKESINCLSNILNSDTSFKIAENYLPQIQVDLQDEDYWIVRALDKNQKIIDAEKNLEELENRKKNWDDSDWQAVFSTGISPIEVSGKTNNSEPEYFISLNLARSFSHNSQIEKQENSLEIKKLEDAIQKEVDSYKRQLLNLHNQLKEQEEIIRKSEEDFETFEKEFEIIQNKRDVGLLGLIDFMEEKIKLKEQELILYRNRLKFINLYLDLLILSNKDIYENRGVLIETY
ncbi:MAG: TolC family protein [bacterium]